MSTNLTRYRASDMEHDLEVDVADSRPPVDGGGSAESVRRRISSSRPRVCLDGKFLAVEGRRFWVKGVTYGSFCPDETGEEYHDNDKISRDFAAMAANGINTVRIPHTVPPPALLDIAGQHGLRVMVGLGAEHYIGFLIDRDKSPDISEIVRQKVRPIAGHPALLCYALGNEIPGGLARWIGRQPIERYLYRLYQTVKREDPNGLVTYVNYPTTEYLRLPFLDLLSFNVYLESRDDFAAYLSRLHNLAGERPLLMSELGLDSLRNGQDGQARSLDWQIRTAFTRGCAGAVVFSWTDEWNRSGRQITDWAFGLTAIDRSPKPALAAVRNAYREMPFSVARKWPRISVVVCTFNGAITLRDSLEGLRRLEYPNHEVILVNDGSNDRSLEIAREFDIRVISTPNHGLSHARNIGMEAASGEIVAYIDDDAWPDPHWLHFLALALEGGDCAGVGGPNLPPASDGPVARCVANAPGGPAHVLLTDEIAEHIPGCNMAFRKEALERVGGFDPRFRSAGDDVDLCWRIQESGATLGFSPAAVVWHRRRSTVRAYLRQQIGYGRAEALLEEKWPQRYNCVGHTAFNGRIYGWGAADTAFSRPTRIYHGIWGSAPFQGLYEQPYGRFGALFLMPEWLFLTFLLGVITFLGVFWMPLLLAAPLFMLVVSLTLARVICAGSAARFVPPPPNHWENLRWRALTSLLHLLQPAARLRGRIAQGLTFWRSRAPRRFALPRETVHSIWAEQGMPPEGWLERIEKELRDAKVPVRRGGDFDPWDLEVRGGLLGGAQLAMAAEDHGAGRQYLRIRICPRFSIPGLLAFGTFAVLGTAAAFSGAWLATATLVFLAGVSATHQLGQWGAANLAIESCLERNTRAAPAR